MSTGPLSASTEYKTLSGLADKVLVRLLIAERASKGKLTVTKRDRGEKAGVDGASGMGSGVDAGVNTGGGAGMIAEVAVGEGTVITGKGKGKGDGLEENSN